MPVKPLSEMSYAELLEAMEAAREQHAAAWYQENISLVALLQDRAQARRAELQAEIDTRLARVAAAGGVPLEEQKDG